MVLRFTRLLLSLLIIGTLGLSVPAFSHDEHKKQTTQQEQPVANQAASPMPSATHETMGEMMEEEPDRSSMSFTERLLDWLGRLHPTMVHFPIAFFPAALFTALVGRRRPTFEAPVQFLAVVGGILAPIAAVLGWLDAMSADPSLLLTTHRWLGTGVGISGLALALWAWRRPHQCRSWGMITALSIITAIIVVQGWYGGALVHGIEHLNW